MNNRLFSLSLLLVIAMILSVEVEANDHRSILVLHSYHKGQHWNDEITKGIESVFKKNGQNIELIFEYMDTKRIYGSSYLEILYQLFNYKYRNKKIDVIISSDDHAFNFLLKNSNTLFPEIPIVFCGVNRFDEVSLVGRKWFTGVVESTDLEKTIEIALHLHPKTKTIFVLVDKTVSGMAHRRQIEDIIPHFDKIVTFDLLEDVELSFIKTKLNDLPENSIVLWMNLFSDMNKNPISLDDGSMLLTKYCDVPSYSLWDNRLDKGIVGGKLISGYDQGKTAAMIAWRILQGEKVEDIPIVYKSPNPFKFDYNQLSRFDIEFSELPAEGIVINQPYSFYSENKRLVWIVISFVIGLVATIIILILNILYRKRAEEELRESEGKYRSVINNANEAIYVVQDTVIKYSNPKTSEITEYGSKELTNKSISEIIHPDDLQMVQHRHRTRQKGEVSKETYTHRMITKNGIIRWIEISPIAFNWENSPSVLVFASDITERKQTEEQIIASLKEKEMMIDEIHHRVKNNMNVISSLLKLQSNNIEDDKTKGILKDSQNRIFAMSAIHETIHGSENLSEIDLKSYISKISSSIFQSSSIDPRKIKLKTDIEEMPISINHASPLGLVINELISNSLKYAFPDESTGDITVVLKKLDEKVELIVNDSGIGIPSELDWKNSRTLGLKLVRTLVENQLGGSIDMESQNGTKFTIKFKIKS